LLYLYYCYMIVRISIKLSKFETYSLKESQTKFTETQLDKSTILYIYKLQRCSWKKDDHGRNEKQSAKTTQTIHDSIALILCTWIAIICFTKETETTQTSTT